MANILVVTVSFLSFMYCIHKKNVEQYNEWDGDTITISDYTMRYEIPPSVYEYFWDEVYEEHPDGLMYSFKRWL